MTTSADGMNATTICCRCRCLAMMMIFSVMMIATTIVLLVHQLDHDDTIIQVGSLTIVTKSTTVGSSSNVVGVKDDDNVNTTRYDLLHDYDSWNRMPTTPVNGDENEETTATKTATTTSNKKPRPTNDLVVFFDDSFDNNNYQNHEALSLTKPPLYEELDDDMLYEYVNWIHRDRIQDDHRYSSSDTTNTRKLQACVSSTAALRAAVARGATNIKVCTPRITLGSHNRRRGLLFASTKQTSSSSSSDGGINVSNRTIKISCALPNRHQRCILDGQGISRIFYGINATLHVSGFNFTNANGTMGSALCFMKSSIVTVHDSSFLNNKATYGGAITVSNSTLLWNNVNTKTSSMITLEGNQGKYGGGIYSIGSKVMTKGHRKIRFENNRARADGGAMYMSQGSTANLHGISMKSNIASNQGGAAVFSSTKVIMNTLTLSKNSANNTSGALIFQDSTFHGTNMLATENSAQKDAGAVALYQSNVTLQNVEFIKNKGTSIGAIGLVRSNVDLQYATFDANDAGTFGGTIKVLRSKVNLSDTTFQSNQNHTAGIYIADRGNPKKTGSFVSCQTEVKFVFCDLIDPHGIHTFIAFAQPTSNKTKNTDCLKEQVVSFCSLPPRPTIDINSPSWVPRLPNTSVPMQVITPMPTPLDTSFPIYYPPSSAPMIPVP